MAKNKLAKAVKVVCVVDGIVFPADHFGGPIHTTFRSLCEKWGVSQTATLAENVLTLTAFARPEDSPTHCGACLCEPNTTTPECPVHGIGKPPRGWDHV